jgi:hypothetical protein
MAETKKSERRTLMQSVHRSPLVRIVVLSLPFAGAILYGLWTYLGTDGIYRDLDAFGVETQATIISKQIIRSGTDRPRFAYEMTVGFSVGDQMRRGKVRVTSGFYDSHNPAEQVTIRYLPNDPQVREIDPAMRGKSMRDAIAIIGILLVIGFANIGMSREAERNRKRRAEEQSQ